MDEQNKNLLVLQMGGPRPAINAALAGIILTAGQYEEITEVYGVRNAPLGLVREELVDLLEEKRPTVQQIQTLTVPALGCSLWGVSPQLETELEQYEEEIFRVLEAHEIRYFIAIGGIEAVRLCRFVHKAAQNRGYEVMVNAIPVSPANDLPYTEHSLGYGSYIRQAMLFLRMLERDLALRPKGEVPCCIVETGGWTTGWESLGPACFSRFASEVPVKALIPEMPMDVKEVAEQMASLIREHGSAILLVPDGMRNRDGSLWAREGFGWDYFGQSVGQSAGAVLVEVLQSKISGFVSRLRLPTLIRWWSAPSSGTDIEETFRCGRTVVEACINQQTGLMAKVRRESVKPYRSTILFHPLDEVLAGTNPVPKEWYDDLDWRPKDAFWRYVEPILQGDAPAAFQRGLPKSVGLQLVPVTPRVHSQAI